MIIKIASLSQSSIDFIELTAGLSFSGFPGKKRLPKAKEYIDDLIIGQFTSYINVESIFGIDKAMLDKVVNYHYSQKLTSEVPLRVTDKTEKSESDIANLAKQISDAIVGYNNSYNEAAADLKSVSNKGELLEKIIEYLNIFISKGYTDFSESKSKAEELLVIEGVQNAPAIQEEIPVPQDVTKEEVVTFSEQPQVLQESLNDAEKDAFNGEHLGHYYVSESSDIRGYFVPGAKFFGPFINKLDAILFSALIHDSYFNDDYSIALGSEVIQKLARRSRTNDKPSLSISSPPESSIIKNEIMKGDFELKAREAGQEISLSTSGDSFKLLVDYLLSNRILNNMGVTQPYFTLGKFKSWYKDGGFFNLEIFISETKPKAGEADATSSFEGQDIAIPDGEGKKVKKTKSTSSIANTAGRDAQAIDEYIKLDGLSGVVNSISIVSAENQTRLSTELLNKCFEEIKTSSLSLDYITDTMVMDNFNACSAKLKSFFESIIAKDKELYSQVISFRSIPDNRLNIYGITDSFEFRNHFSIIQKIISEEAIISRISRIIGLIRYYSNYDKINNKISTELNAYLSAAGRDQTTDESKIDSYIEKIQKSVFESIIYAANITLRKNLFDIVNGSLKIDPDKLLDKVIEDVSANSLIQSKVRTLSMSKEDLLAESKISVIVCGVCSQEFSIPKNHQDLLKTIDKKIKQRTFFKENGDLITEQELVSNNKKYTLSADAESLLLNVQKTNTRFAPASRILRVRDGEETEIKIEKSYTWEEANKMTISNSIDEQINGHIIRTDILASLGAAEAGRRGAFTNKVLCAGQLYNLSENIKQVGTTKAFVSKKDNFKCMGSRPENADDYMSSANIMPRKVDLSADTPESTRYSGFRFSTNNANCPCYLTKQSDQMITWASKPNNYNPKFIIAVPNIPGDVAQQIAEIGSDFNVDSLYYPPTSSDGMLMSGMQNSAYVVCANKTSISMFDRDPSSDNFIQKFFKKALDNGGIKRLSDTVAALINYGIEINDIRPHVEAVVASQPSIVTSASRKNVLQSIFKNYKISLAQDMSDSNAQLIKDLGLVCQNGHKFTIDQSWRFAKTHSSILTGSEGKLTSTPIKREQINAILDANGRDMSSLINIGAIKTTTDEESLRKEGYRQPSELSNLIEIQNFIKEKKLYFKSADDKMYYMSYKTMSGKIKETPWDTDELSGPTKFNRNFWQFQSGIQSTTVEGEGGKAEVSDIASPIQDAPDEPEYGESDDYDGVLNFARAVIPDIDIDSAKTIISRFTQSRERDVYVKAKTFVDNLITTLTISRVWGPMAADAQIDFLAGLKKSEPKNIPNIRQMIESELTSILSNIEKTHGITSADPGAFMSQFFSEFDVLGLIERGVTSEQFFGLATIAEYYKGFSVPPILNLTGERAMDAVLESLNSALLESIPRMTSTHFGVQDLKKPNLAKIERISELLIAPYADVFSTNGYKSLIKSPIVDYNGRAIIFSFAVDLADKINSFFSTHFFNEASSLYIGPLGSADRSPLMIIRDLLEGKMIYGADGADGVFVQNLLILEESDFKSKIDNLRKMLYETYKLDNLFQNYMQYKSIPVSADIVEVQKQRSIVLDRFGKIFDAANNSIEIVKIDLSGKRVDSPSVKRASKLLDRTIDIFAKRREELLFPGGRPAGTATLLDVIKKNRDELNRGVFETNSIGYAKVNLSDFNEGLDKVTFESLSISRFSIKESLVNRDAINADLDNDSKIQPLGNAKIFELKIISIGKILSKIGTDIVEYRICVVTPIRIKTAVGLIETLPDAKKYLNFDGINLINPNQQGIDFISRYTRNVMSDTSRFILINSKNTEGSGESVNIDDPSLLQMRMSVNSTMKVGKITKIADDNIFWPPKNNLFIDEANTGKDPADVNRNYDSLTSPADHSLFMANIENFEISKTAKTYDTTSSHGVLIPLKYEENITGGKKTNNEEGAPSNIKTLMGKISQIGNVILDPSGEHKKHFFTISDAKIYISSQSFGDSMIESKPLDISWAFNMLNPQISDEQGVTKHKLIQSTVVRKLDFISSEMIKCYELINKKSNISISALLEEEYPGLNTTESFDIFCNFLFSDCISWLKVSPDMSRGVKQARLDVSEIDFDAINNELIVAGANENVQEMINTLSKFIDYYNASQILNLEYSKLTPSISNSEVFNISLGYKTKSLSLKLLDPYSMWRMVNSKSMTTKFGGPIDSENIDQYREFIISTFGIADIAKKVCEKVGFTNGEFAPADMFNIAGFCKRYKSHPKIKNFKDLFSLKSVALDEDDDIKIYGDDIETYSNGMPICSGKTKDLTSIISNAEYGEYSLGQSSYIKHLYRTKTLLNNLTGAQLKDPKEVAKYKELIRNLEDGTATMSLKDLVSLEISLRLDNPSLFKEFSEIMFRLSKRPKTSSDNNISWRKIAQSATDDEGTIIRSLYHEWWDRYLNVMAKIAAQE